MSVANAHYDYDDLFSSLRLPDVPQLYEGFRGKGGAAVGH